MPAQRCSMCAVNWPLGVDACEACGGPLSPRLEATPDSDWEREQAVRRALEKPPEEAQRVATWRLLVLIEARYPFPLAEKLAADPGVDIHRAVKLVCEQACPHDLAAEILL